MKTVWDNSNCDHSWNNCSSH